MWVPNRVLKYQVGACVKDCYVGMGGYVPWDVSFTRVLHPFEESEFELLLSLFTNIFISREEVHMHLEALPFQSACCQDHQLASLVGFGSPRVETFLTGVFGSLVLECIIS